MPEMDGLQLLREVKRLWPRLEVIMITAYNDDERRRVANEFGAADFLNKPIDFDHLKRRILAFVPDGPHP
jgi:DNA-binding response OmpR family regulator